MQQRSNSGYNIKNVHKVNLVGIVITTIFLITISFIMHGKDEGLLILMKSVIVLGGSFAAYFIPFKDDIKAMLYSLLPAAIAAQGFMGSAFSLLGCHYLIFISICMITLYFNKKLILIYGIILNALILTLSIVAGDKVFIDAKPSALLILMLLLYINVSISFLFTLAYWGHSLILSAQEKEKKALELIDQLNITLTQINESSDILDKNILLVNENISSTKDSMASINIAVQEMTRGAAENATSINQINDNIYTMSKGVDHTLNIAQEVKKDSSEIMEKVQIGSDNMEDMTSQMKIIYNAVNTSFVTVKELEENIESINTFLSNIEQIAEQTNLLALNAAIEAARAGEQGKGFAVVAEQIRKLADQSSKTLKEINDIITDITAKTGIVVEKVQLGDDAVVVGNQLITNVNESFFAIRAAFERTNLSLVKETELVEGLADRFADIQNQVENIAAISQEQAATVQEVSATTETESSHIIKTHELVSEIKLLSKHLKEIADNIEKSE